MKVKTIINNDTYFKMIESSDFEVSPKTTESSLISKEEPGVVVSGYKPPVPVPLNNVISSSNHWFENSPWSTNNNEK
jgi:hypothetical protein